MHLPPRLLPHKGLQVRDRHVRYLLYIPGLDDQIHQVLGRHARDDAKHVLRLTVEGLVLGPHVLVEADADGGDGVRLLLLRLEVLEDLGGLVRRAGPDDAEAWEGEREEDELGLQVGARISGVQGGEGA